MKITRIETFILHVPVTGQGIADSKHAITHWGVPGAIVHTDAGITGYGYSGTHAHLPSDRLITQCVETCLAPSLVGRDPTEVTALWREMVLCSPLQWVGRGGIIQLAIGAVDVALWDIKAKAAGQPLWQFLGGAEKKVVAYNTDGGWLNWPLDTLVDDCRRCVEERGFKGVKMKVGSPDMRRDVERVAAVRKAVGPSILLAVDANGHMDLPTAIRLGRHLDDNDVLWFEEPLWYDDIEGHRRLARAMRTPIALGEQLYLVDNFTHFVERGALHYAQPDVTRLGGVTPWLRVADMTAAHRLPVAAHAGDMMQIHLHLTIAHPACELLEHIPWLRPCFTEPVTVVDGVCAIPREPGAGTTLRPDARERFGVS